MNGPMAQILPDDEESRLFAVPRSLIRRPIDLEPVCADEALESVSDGLGADLARLQMSARLIGVRLFAHIVVAAVHFLSGGHGG